MLREHDQVVVIADFTRYEAQDLRPGDVGVSVHVHPDGDAYLVDFLTHDGETAPIVTVQYTQARTAPGRA